MAERTARRSLEAKRNGSVARQQFDQNSPAEYILHVRQPLHGLLVDFCNSESLGQRADVNSSSDVREILQIAIGGLHSIKLEGDKRQKQQNLRTRRTLEWILNLFNLHAHDHEVVPDLLASSLASSIHLFLHKNSSVSDHQKTIVLKMGTPFWRPSGQSLQDSEVHLPSTQLEETIDSPPTNSDDTAKPVLSSESNLSTRSHSEIRAELLGLKNEIEEHYSSKRAKLEPWEHILQNSKLTDLINAHPKDKSSLQKWVSTLKSYTKNTDIMNDQVETFHGEILATLSPQQFDVF